MIQMSDGSDELSRPHPPPPQMNASPTKLLQASLRAHAWFLLISETSPATPQSNCSHAMQSAPKVFRQALRLAFFRRMYFLRFLRGTIRPSEHGKYSKLLSLAWSHLDSCHLTQSISTTSQMPIG